MDGPGTLDASAIRGLKLDFQGIRGIRTSARKYLSAARVNVYASGNWLSFTDGGGLGPAKGGRANCTAIYSQRYLITNPLSTSTFMSPETASSPRCVIGGEFAPCRNRYQLIFRFHFRPCKPGSTYNPRSDRQNPSNLKSSPPIERFSPPVF